MNLIMLRKYRLIPAMLLKEQDEDVFCSFIARDPTLMIDEWVL